jgi:hypothetical protein
MAGLIGTDALMKPKFALLTALLLTPLAVLQDVKTNKP